MNLEELLTALIAAIDANTAALIAKKSVAITNSQKPTPVHTPTEAVTAEDLQTLCTQIVRKDRTKKVKIVAVLAAYDNAKLISDIDDKSYPAIKVKLEALL